MGKQKTTVNIKKEEVASPSRHRKSKTAQSTDLAIPAEEKSKKQKVAKEESLPPPSGPIAPEAPSPKKRRKTPRKAVAEQPKFSLADVTNSLCENPPSLLDVRDEQLSLALLEDMERGMLDDMIGFFLIGEGIKTDEATIWGPPKWKYSETDDFDSFDYYVATGCPNCGAAYELDFHHNYCLNPPALTCFSCGHRACPMHFDTESESLVDRLDTKPPSSQGIHDGLSSSPSPLFGGTADCVAKDDAEAACARAAQPGAVYVRGTRSRHYFGQNSKDWWQAQFLPRHVRLNDLHRTLTMIGMMSKLKAPTIDEMCEVCGNDKAYFHTYQARSADEGMTIMYECTRCHARKTFNN